MAQKIRKGLFKIMPWSMVSLMVFALVVGAWQFAPVKNAQAAALSPTSTVYQDLNGDGDVDNIKISFTLVTACTYEAGDWAIGVAGTVTVATITGISNTGSCTTDNYINLTVTAATDVTGGGVNPRVDYTDAGAGGSVAADGNIGAANFTATDGAAPYLISATYSDSDGSGVVDQVAFLFSEVTTWTTITAADWAFTTPGDIGLGANDTDFVIGDCAGSGTLSTITCTDTNNSSIEADANETGKQTTGGAEPVLTYTNNTNNINDGINNTASFTKTLNDGAAAITLSRVTKDTDLATGAAGTTNGTMDGILTTWTEAMDASSVVAADFTITLAAGTGLTETYADTTDDTTLFFKVSDCTANDTSNLLNLEVNGAILDLAGVIAVGSPATASTDGTAPVVMSVTPTSGSVGVSRLANIVITFSEAMDTTFDEGTEYTVSPDPGAFTKVWSLGNTVVTISHASQFNVQVITVTTVEAQIVDAGAGLTLQTTGPDDGDWTFTTASSGSSNTGTGSGSTSTTPTVTLTAPADGADLTGGDVQAITWTTSGSGLDTVGLYYSTDNGATYNQIAYNISKSLGTYDWTLPNIDSEQVLVKIMVYDSGKAVLDTDVSEAMTISAISEELIDEEEITPVEEFTTTDEEGRTVADNSGEVGPSPVTGLDEEISTVLAGWFVRSYSFDTIYYVDEYSIRYPFWDTNSFFSYADSFDEVVWVTDATLPTMDLGGPMLPAFGSVLVKIQSDPKVYAIDSGNVLRWVPSEDTAIALYGADWADYVIDLEPTTMARFTTGSDMTVDDVVYLEYMKTRMELASDAQ